MCFEADSTCFMFSLDYSASLYTMDWVPFVSEDVSVDPTFSDYAKPSTEYYGFSESYFYSKASDWADLSEGYLFFKFMKIDTEDKMQVNDEVTIWTYALLSSDGPYENTDFELLAAETLALTVISSVAVLSCI